MIAGNSFYSTSDNYSMFSTFCANRVLLLCEQFLAVKVIGIMTVENPEALHVTNVFHADGRLKIGLDGVLPSQALNYLVFLYGASPLVDGIHAIDNITSDAGIYIRLQKRIGNNGVLYDSRESQDIARYAHTVSAFE